MSSSIEIITTPTSDTRGTTLILRTATKHYLFGSLAEGTQRAITQQGAKVIKAHDYFVTGRSEWSNTGGMMGMMLTLAGSSLDSREQALELQRQLKAQGRVAPDPPKPHFNVYGPRNLKETITASRRFIFRKGIPLKTTEFSQDDQNLQRDESDIILPTWQDSSIQVWALSVKPTGYSSSAQAEAELEERRQYFDAHLNNFEDHQPPDHETPEDRKARYDRIQELTVKYMFDSNWSFDTLVEQHISKVEMPTAIFVRNPRTHGYEPYKGPMPGGSQALPDINVFTRTPWPGAKIISLPPTQPVPDCVSYIVRTHGFRGTFDVARAKALGVTPGPDFGKLSQGESVQNQSGEWIRPEQVLGAERPGQGVAILEIPTVEYIQNTLQREELNSPQILHGIEAFIWILGPGVLGHPSLNEFFGTMHQVKHVISSSEISPNRITHDSVAAQTTRLGQIDPARYCTPKHDNVQVPQGLLWSGSSARPSSLPKEVIAADRGMSYVLMPKFADKEPASVLFNPDDIRMETSPEVLDLAQKARSDIEGHKESMQIWRRTLARPDTEVITLGTGSSLPSKYRNVSATLVRVPGVGNYLFDAGEGTLGQLTRMFSVDELTNVLKDLRMIWISHLHADHHLGTVSVIKAWYDIVHGGVPNPQSLEASSTIDDGSYGLAVISHSGMLQWLHEYSFIEDFGYSRILPLQISPNDHGKSSSLSILNSFGVNPSAFPAIPRQKYQGIFGFSNIEAVFVRHCFGAMAVSVTFPPSAADGDDVKPLKISYSGDCRPSHRFSEIGKDTTVLIHEATFDDELVGDAIAKKHSTTSEALGVGAKMNAKSVVLTHFSQRYQKIPVLQTVNEGEQEDPLLNAANVVDEPIENEEEDLDNANDNQGNTDIFPAPASAARSIVHENERIIKIKNKDMKVGIAFDYMRVKIGEIIELEKFNDALNLLLTKDEESEEKANDDGKVNANGKKTSGDEAAGQGKKQKTQKKQKQKSKRNN